MDLIDIFMMLSFFFINLCLVLFIVSEDVRRHLSKIKQRFNHKILRKNIVVPRNNSQSNHPLTLEERRREAMDYLVAKYYESKKREEDYIKKIRSYGKIRRWTYQIFQSIKEFLFFIKEIIAKPVIITLMAYSTYISLWFGTKYGPYVSRLTKMYIPSPLNHILDLLILFPIGFLPGILSILFTYYVQKRELRRILQTYNLKL